MIIEKLKIEPRVRWIENGFLHVEYYPVNPELRDLANTGKELEIVGSIAETVAAYAPTAMQELLNTFNSMNIGVTYIADEG